MAIFKNIISYSLSVPFNTTNVRGIIRLQCVDGWNIVVQFQEATVLPNNQLNLAAKSLLAFGKADSYANVVDLVRNEKPCSIFINELTTPPSFFISTGSEPVGDGEI
jgi:hypothetical protein